MKIKSKFSRILGVCLTVIMLGSMLTTATPAVALSSATVTLNKTDVGSILALGTFGSHRVQPSKMHTTVVGISPSNGQQVSP